MKDFSWPNLESNVRSYCRNFPEVFLKAEGCLLQGSTGRRYLDFLSGCGSLNYGHNDPILRAALIEYVEGDGISMSLDMETASKARFMERFHAAILAPRGMRYKLQFPGPTGANAVEAAIKLARKATGRTNVVAFTNAFHGCTLGALSLTGSGHHRAASAPLLNQVTRLPYDGYLGDGIDTAALLETLLDDPSSGVDAPAAIILETLQGEGGLNLASDAWLKRIQRIARRHGAVLIVDDIQAGCGRRGGFFSFEGTGLEPDMVVLAKSLSGYGLPFAMLLMRPDLDVWEAGEHNGTFRGNNLAFVTGARAFEAYWSDATMSHETRRKAELVRRALTGIADDHGFVRKGDGLMQGLEVEDADLSRRIRRRCFETGLILEASGPHDTVLKLMPPLTIEDDFLGLGLDILASAIAETTRPPSFTIPLALAAGDVKETLS